MHGEHRHLRAHAKLGVDNGYASVVVTNGMVLNLSGNSPTIEEFVETARTYVDGSTQISALDGVIRDRIRLVIPYINILGCYRGYWSTKYQTFDGLFIDCTLVPLAALAFGAIFSGMYFYKPFFGDHHKVEQAL